MASSTTTGVIRLEFPYKRIRVFPDRDLRATIIELSMIDTRIMQRLRNTKQLGNSNISYPTAEHSRFSHSLGVLYWVSKILTALNDNYNSSFNKIRLQKMNEIVKSYIKRKLAIDESGVNSKVFESDTFLGVTWFEQLVRLYGLLHDITHIPFGHTIEDQACLFERHDDDLDRLNFVFDMLKNEVKTSYHFTESEYADQLLPITMEYINLVKLMFVVGSITSDPNSDDETREVWIKEWELMNIEIREPLLLSYDIVSNTICADLMDYTLRDTMFASMPKTFDKVLLTCMKIVEYKTIFFERKKISKQMFRLGVSVSRKKVRHDIITAILDLLRIRYDLTEKVYYHHTKVIMDAMLEKILRSLPNESLFNPKEIYLQYLGDEGFLRLLEKKLATEHLDHGKEILDKMFNRNLYKTVFRINKDEHLSRIGKNNVITCSKPTGRNQIEQELITELRDTYNTSLSDGDIIISYPPEKMQKKIAKALIEWSDGQIFTFENLPKEAGYSNEVGMLTERYSSLWSMNVFVNPNKIQYIRLIESICEQKFDIRNESILKNYLKETYSEHYNSHDEMIKINHKVISLESNFIVSKAAKGNSKINDKDRVEMTENAYMQAIGERREKRKSSKKAKDEKPDAPSLNL